MTVFSEMADLGHEQLVFCRNDDVGLRGLERLAMLERECTPLREAMARMAPEQLVARILCGKIFIHLD